MGLKQNPNLEPFLTRSGLALAFFGGLVLLRPAPTHYHPYTQDTNEEGMHVERENT